FRWDVVPEPPEDPVLARLLPDAYEDAEDAAEFRRFTEHDLRHKKLDQLKVLAGSLGGGGAIQLRPEDATAWMVALNDIRLALGTRLEITEDPDDAPADDDPARGLYEVYQWLTYLQDSLIDALAS